MFLIRGGVQIDLGCMIVSFQEVISHWSIYFGLNLHIILLNPLTVGNRVVDCYLIMYEIPFLLGCSASRGMKQTFSCLSKLGGTTNLTRFLFAHFKYF